MKKSHVVVLVAAALGRLRCRRLARTGRAISGPGIADQTCRFAAYSSQPLLGRQRLGPLRRSTTHDIPGTSNPGLHNVHME